MPVICTTSAEETMFFGEALGSQLAHGDVVALSGELGAGKTTLTKGIARGAGVTAEVFSPTFTLIHEHPGRVPFYHIDLYRLTGQEDTEYLGLDEYLYGEGIVVIEWADRAPAALPDERIDIALIAIDDDKRELRIDATSDRLREIVELVVSSAGSCD
ncbi:MAG: tRNA (adenosine(37)-N6)-threonylcarbamoyltransferase complex ATPase subunit type 1 TsaE [Armatimonadetes bacterium]|nr:tRNA (adenosine(37)-N6)-threonylcarbamoyltransferase complex ATPase subunit type 1 TsaE [Armatimonadota bacterium]